MANELSEEIGVSKTCLALGISKATFYRRRLPEAPKEASPARRDTVRRLSDEERKDVIDHLHANEFVDDPPRQVYGKLLERGKYVASVSTMYRILRSLNEVRDRRNQRTHPKRSMPRLCATGPNQVWSWDITKLHGPGKWRYFHLYVILDIFSRYVVGWMVAAEERASNAKRLIENSCRKFEVVPGTLTLHADNGAPMISKTVGQLCIDLEIDRSHSRPRVSNDNPFSESQFKTLKYCPTFPKRFQTIEEAQEFCRAFFQWYNWEHRHTGIGLLTPTDVHFGNVELIQAKRQKVLDSACSLHPERFVNGPPRPPSVPNEVWINRPDQNTVEVSPLLTKLEMEVSQSC